MGSQSYECNSCVHHEVPNHKDPCRGCVNGMNYEVNPPTTQRSSGNLNLAELLHRIAVANQLALAAKPIVDDLRKQFQQHPMVLAFDDYAEVTIDSEIRRQLKELDNFPA